MKNKLKNLKEQINDIGNFVGLKRIGIVIFLTFLSVIPNVYSTSSPNIWNSLFELGINHVYIIFLIAIISYNVIYMAEATKNSNFLIRYAGYKNYLKDQIKKILIIIFLVFIFSLFFEILLHIIFHGWDFNFLDIKIYEMPIIVYLLFYYLRFYLFLSLIIILIYFLYQIGGRILTYIILLLFIFSFNLDIYTKTVNSLFEIPLLLTNYFQFVNYSNFFLEITASFLQFYILIGIMFLLKYILMNKKENIL